MLPLCHLFPQISTSDPPGISRKPTAEPPPNKCSRTHEPRHCCPTPPNAAQHSGTAPAAGIPAQPIVHLCNLGNTGELAKSCQGNPFMQRLHFGPRKEMSRHRRVAKAQSCQLRPPVCQPCGVLAATPRWLLRNSAESLAQYISKGLILLFISKALKIFIAWREITQRFRRAVSCQLTEGRR